MFHIHPVPDKVMTLVIQHMYGALSSSAIAAPSLTGRTDETCSIARLLFVLGQTCLSSLVYTEAIAATAKKYPSTSCSSNKEDPTGGGRESKTRGAAKTSSPSSSSSSSGEGTGFTENVEAVDAMEEEMGAAAADDADREKVLPTLSYYILSITHALTSPTLDDERLSVSACIIDAERYHRAATGGEEPPR